MSKEIVLPELGDGIETGEVVNILVSTGDDVAQDSVLLELETDKAVIELPSPQSGKIASVRIKKGDTVKVGQVLFTLESADASSEKPETEPQEEKKPEEAKQHTEDKKAKEDKQPVAEEGQAASVKGESQDVSSQPDDQKPTAEDGKTTGKLIPAGPATRRLARDLGIDLSTVKGTARGGRITPDDIKAHAKLLLRAGSFPGAQPVEELPDFSQWGPIETKPLPSLRRKVAENLSSAWPRVPLVTQFDEADITELENMRKKNIEYVKQKGGKLTMTVFVLKAVVAALKALPQFNASLDMTHKELIYKKYFNVGVAVDTPAGLIVPVLKNVDQKSFTELAIELTELSEKARSRKVALEDLRGGNISISNLGGIGGTGFTPLVSPPDVAVVGLSRNKLVPVWRQDRFQPRLILPFSVSYDHRVIDGADAVRFSRSIAHELETYQELLLEG
jgi:pyruvate dehydrogenase E2 component (dihydrolipoyllysine-residue acetyltransferase)